mgnify:CR=1 FL=1
MSDYHEVSAEINEGSKDAVRALTSLKEEIEAIDWYDQRISASNNDELVGILQHNKEEEMEHAAMLLEWLRRNMEGWDDALATYLFKTAPILELEEQAEAAEEGEVSPDLGVGSLKSATRE